MSISKSTRIKRVKGIHREEDFQRLLRQFDGRALVAIALINIHCEGCKAMMKFINQLEKGLIQKMPKLVMIYGRSNILLDEDGLPKTSDSEESEDLEEDEDSEESGDSEESEDLEEDEDSEEQKEKQPLQDSRYFHWDALTQGHGYKIYFGSENVSTHEGIFDHEKFHVELLDMLRRFDSSVRTLSDLQAKKNFIERGGTGLIIETCRTTSESKVMKIESQAQDIYKNKQLPIYFLRGLTEEISFVSAGNTVYKQKGLNLSKALKYLP